MFVCVGETLGCPFAEWNELQYECVFASVIVCACPATHFGLVMRATRTICWYGHSVSPIRIIGAKVRSNTLANNPLNRAGVHFCALCVGIISRSQRKLELNRVERQKCTQSVWLPTHLLAGWLRLFTATQLAQSLYSTY